MVADLLIIDVAIIVLVVWESYKKYWWSILRK